MSNRLPDLLFIVDTNVEALAVDEANKVSVPIIAMVDTNSNPDKITYVIPSNDDAIRAVKLVVGAVADAAEEGMRIREVDQAETGQVSRRDLAEMEQYLGPSVLAKLQTIDIDSEIAEEYAGDEVAAIEDVVAEIDDLAAEVDGGFETIGEDEQK
jgi:small subunit ribosomal protein S2